jgi:hypothetical protein
MTTRRNPAGASATLWAWAKHRLKMSNPFATEPLENPRKCWYTTAVMKPLATLARNQDYE